MTDVHLNGKTNGKAPHTHAASNGHQETTPVRICECERKIPATAKFCPYCGLRGKGAITAPRFCLNCITPAQPDWSKCIECGKEIADPTTIDPDACKKQRDSEKEAAIMSRCRLPAHPTKLLCYNDEVVQWTIASLALSGASYVGSRMNGFELLTALRASSVDFQQTPAFASYCLSIFPCPVNASIPSLPLLERAHYIEAVMLWLLDTAFARGWLIADVLPNATENGELLELVHYSEKAALFFKATDPSFRTDEDFSFDFAMLWAVAYNMGRFGLPYAGNHPPFPLGTVRQRFASYKADIEAKEGTYASQPDSPEMETKGERVCGFCFADVSGTDVKCRSCHQSLKMVKQYGSTEVIDHTKEKVAERFCYSCGEPIRQPGAMYCEACAAYLVASLAQTTSYRDRYGYGRYHTLQSIPAIRFCGVCGCKVCTKQAIFCFFCGTTLDYPTDGDPVLAYCSEQSHPVRVFGQKFCLECGVVLSLAVQKKVPGVPPARWIVESTLQAIPAFPASHTDPSSEKEHQTRYPIVEAKGAPAVTPLPLCKQCRKAPARHQGAAFCADCLNKPWPEYPRLQQRTMSLPAAPFGFHKR